MKKNGSPLKMILLLTVFCLYGILKMSSAIIELTKDTESSQKEQKHKIAQYRTFGSPVISYIKSSAKTK
jgi:hypothetical protein